MSDKPTKKGKQAPDLGAPPAKTLTQTEVDKLSAGTAIRVWWGGLNGPHEYRMGWGMAVDSEAVEAMAVRPDRSTPLRNVGLKKTSTRVIVAPDPKI